MENVGCVTFREDYLRVGDQHPSLYSRRQLMEVTLHELAHHWFGNLVTLKWWNDIWLNESFATYISYLAMSEVLGEDYKGAVWIDFMGRKFEGIKADIDRTT
jgi:aminopeptidase N